jgi:L-fucose mutarotase/ribose pyranase (RbsD/FucU family)
VDSVEAAVVGLAEAVLAVLPVDQAVQAVVLPAEQAVQVEQQVAVQPRVTARPEVTMRREGS